jgi:hypothetical protein
MKQPQDLSREELEAIVGKIQAILYATPYLNEKGRERTKFDRNKVWGIDELEEIDQVLVNADLSPPDPDDA